MSLSLNHLYPKAQRPLTQITNEADEPIVFVTLASGQCAFLDAEDFRNIMAMGVSPNWSFDSNGSQRAYVRVPPPANFEWKGHTVPISRLIMAPRFRGIVVRYHDGNRLNLRRRNLVVRSGRTPALARERQLEDPFAPSLPCAA